MDRMTKREFRQIIQEEVARMVQQAYQEIAKIGDTVMVKDNNNKTLLKGFIFEAKEIDGEKYYKMTPRITEDLQTIKNTSVIIEEERLVPCSLLLTERAK